MSYFTDPTVGQNGQQTTENWLEKVVQEKGDQWSDPNVLAKGYANSQAMIEQLKKTNEELLEDLGKKNYTEELLEEIRKGKAQPPAGEPNGKDSGTTPNGNTDQQVSEENVKRLIEQTLTQREKDNTAQENLRLTDKKLQELFGTEVQKIVDQRSQELGMSKERLQELASESPTAFFKLIGEEPKELKKSVFNSSVNTSAGFMDRPATKDWNYYQKLRRENPNMYYSPKVQNQLLKDRLEQGDKFGN